MAHSRRIVDFRRLQPALAVLAAVAVYANTLPNSFVDDDEAQVLRNPWIADWHRLPDIFTQGDWSFVHDAGASNYYRPLRHVIYAIVHHLCGLQAWGFHLASVMFHAAGTLLVFLLTAQVPAIPPAAPFVAALLFATHPVHTEAVAWVSAITEVAFAVFSLATLYAYARTERPFTVPHGLAAGAFLLALLCKESAVTVLLLLPAWDIAAGRARRAREYAVVLAPFVAAALLYAVLRHRALAGALLPYTNDYGLTPTQLALSAVPLLAEYLRQLAVPLPLNFWHAFHPILSALDPRFLGAALVGASTLGALALAHRHSPAAFFAGALIVVPLLPALFIAAFPGRPYGERYLYLPSAGFSIAAAWVLVRACTDRPRLLLLLVVPILAFSTAATVRRNAVWRDALTLFSDTVEQTPDAPLPRYGLANALFAAGRLDEAIAEYRTLVRAEPRNARFQSALGGALMTADRLDEALDHLGTARALNPACVETHNALGLALRKSGRPTEALRAFEQAVTLDPEDGEPQSNLGLLLLELGRTDAANGHLRAAVRLKPDNAAAHNALGILAGQTGRLDDAIAHFAAAVAAAPREAAFRSNLQRAQSMRAPHALEVP